MVAALTRLFGPRHIELAEDVVQETLLKAMREWPFRGVPDEPAAWLHHVARNLAIDHLRRDARGLELLKENAALLRSEWTLSSTVNDLMNEPGIADDQLRMIFACCHPALSEEQQVALALKTLCGFGVPEIAHAFQTNEETINKRLYRAREAFRELGRLEIPSGYAFSARLEQVLSIIYLLFNEGYNATRHDDLIREDLIEEALRLCALVTLNPVTEAPSVHALLALMLFHAARSEARMDPQGALVLLKDQDRSRWNRDLIALANQHLDRSAQGERMTTYHLEAGIAAVHANASTYESTDQHTILGLYDELLLVKPTPIVRFNRAIAIAGSLGAEAGLAALDAITELDSNHLFHAARGDLLLRSGQRARSGEAFVRALELARAPAEVAFLRKKLGDV